VPSPIDLRDPAAVAARRPLRIAHRGGVVGPGAPENSLAAVERAAAAGYDLVELDVERSREGEPFLFHDRGGHLGRCCGVDARIADLPAAALASLTYRASDQPLASLDAALARCAALGLGVVLACTARTRTIALVVVVALNLLSEAVSFSRLIDVIPPLRALDRWGSRRR
jgi:hypothetical protein